MFKARYFLQTHVAVCLIVFAGAAISVAQTRRAQVVEGRRAIVCDERLSVLRARPDITAPLVQRLRRGRVVGITGATRSRDGLQYLRVTVTRRTRGWILSEAVVRSGQRTDAERLMDLIETAGDDFVKLRLARICADEFRRTETAARALLLLGETAERMAQQLTRLAQRRIKAEEQNHRVYLLNDIGLDRCNRIGVGFRTDPAGERLIYDGAAYRELLRRYPRAPEADRARERLRKAG
jgi:hypothetical protein